MGMKILIEICFSSSLKKDSRTRRHEVKLVKDQCRLDIMKYSSSQRTINEWNYTVVSAFLCIDDMSLSDHLLVLSLLLS